MIPQKIIFIGASSLFGRMDAEGGGFTGRFKKWHEMNDNRNVVFNLGISGDTTTGMLKRLIPECSIRKPDLIIFSLGLNDIKRTGSKNAPVITPLDDFKNNIQKLIEQAKNLADLLFVSAYPVIEEKTSPMEGKNIYYLLDDAKKYVLETKKICKSIDLPYLNIFDKWIKEGYSQYIFEDGLHCNSVGHQKIFEELKKFMLKQYE